MSKKCRSLNQQFNYAISNCCRIGHSKRAEQGINSGYVFSVQYAENLRDTVLNLSNFIKVNYPQIRWVRDVKSEHIQAWIDNRSPNWSKATLENHISRLGIIQKQIKKTYQIDTDWNFTVPVKSDVSKVRNQAMTREDYLKLQELLDKRTGVAKVAVNITARTGLRIKEIAMLRGEHINLQKNIIEVREGAKNGKYRDVPIRPSDVEYFRNLKDSLVSDSDYVCRGVKEDSINRGIRRAMDNLGLNVRYHMTTNHALRKMYAQESFRALVDKGLDEKKAWSIVQMNLGHGKKFRQALYDTYIEGK